VPSLGLQAPLMEAPGLQMLLTQTDRKNDDGTVQQNADGSPVKRPVLRFHCIVSPLKHIHRQTYCDEFLLLRVFLVLLLPPYSLPCNCAGVPDSCYKCTPGYSGPSSWPHHAVCHLSALAVSRHTIIRSLHIAFRISYPSKPVPRPICLPMTNQGCTPSPDQDTQDLAAVMRVRLCN
jgi:hypothetical protein